MSPPASRAGRGGRGKGGKAGIPDVLARIVEQRRRRIEEAREDSATLRVPQKVEPDRSFVDALRARRGRALIAEVKLGSPRLGDLSKRVDPVAQARAYVRAGASALSVVVEPDFFFGSYTLLRRLRAETGLPALAKDFVIDELQLYWAHEAGAQAVLLIAAILERDRLHHLAARARRLGLVPLVETHDQADLEKLDGADWELVGINNRDLRTFEVDLERSMRLVEQIPEGAVRVAESGIQGGADVRRLAGAGFDAFLVGESLLLAEDPEAKLRELIV